MHDSKNNVFGLGPHFDQIIFLTCPISSLQHLPGPSNVAKTLRGSSLRKRKKSNFRSTIEINLILNESTIFIPQVDQNFGNNKKGLRNFNKNIKRTFFNDNNFRYFSQKLVITIIVENFYITSLIASSRKVLKRHN